MRCATFRAVLGHCLVELGTYIPSPVYIQLLRANLYLPTSVTHKSLHTSLMFVFSVTGISNTCPGCADAGDRAVLGASLLLVSESSVR